MKKYDAIVVGGGPIGGFISNRLAENDCNVAVIEKNKNIGAPMNCAGLVTNRVFEKFNISKNNIVLNEIKGAYIHSPKGSILKIGGNKTHALVINRTEFDQNIMYNAESNGADVFLDCKVTLISNKKKLLNVKTSKDFDFASKLLIGADGPFSKVRQTFLKTEPKEILYGAGAEISGTNISSDFVHIFLGNQIAPGFFAWLIPTNKNGSFARVGLCVNKNAEHSVNHYFKNLFREKGIAELLKGTKIERKMGGAIPLGYIKKNVTSNIMVVGDAAAQVKPTSGGGIFPGLLCANFCSEVALDAIKKNDFSENFLKKYQTLCFKNIGRELIKGSRFRSVFKRLSDESLDKYVVKFSNPQLVRIINDHGDIDFPSKLVRPLIKKSPLLLKSVFSI